MHDQTIDLALELGRELDKRNTPSISFGYADLYVHALDLDQVLVKAARTYPDPLINPVISKAVIPTIQKIQDTLLSFNENDRTLLWYIRYLSQLLARYMLNEADRLSQRATWVTQKPAAKDYGLRKAIVIKRAGNAYLDIYVAFAILELRMQGKLPAWEGILLVKGRG